MDLQIYHQINEQKCYDKCAKSAEPMVYIVRIATPNWSTNVVFIPIQLTASVTVARPAASSLMI